MVSYFEKQQESIKKEDCCFFFEQKKHTLYSQLQLGIKNDGQVFFRNFFQKKKINKGLTFKCQ